MGQISPLVYCLPDYNGHQKCSTECRDEWKKNCYQSEDDAGDVLNRRNRGVSDSSSPVSYTHLTLPTICSV